MKLKIGGHQYTINVASMPEDELGACDYNKATITIDSNITEQSIKESTLIHEILHACNSTFWHSGIEHGLLDSISEQLYQVLKDNNMLNQTTFDRILK